MFWDIDSESDSQETDLLTRISIYSGIDIFTFTTIVIIQNILFLVSDTWETSLLIRTWIGKQEAEHNS